MAFPRIGGAGVPLDLATMNNYWDLKGITTIPGFGFNTVTLPAGNVWLIPAGTFQVTPGPYSQLQFLDPVTGIYRSLGQTPNTSVIVGSDGYNWRLANLTGCVLGAYMTNVGSGYTSAPTVTASAGGATFSAIVGGAINSSITITSGGAGYLYPPIIIIAAPPGGGDVQATATCTVSGGAVNAVTVVNQGAGYTTVPKILVVNDPRDTAGSGCVLTAALTGSGTVTAVLCTNHGTPQTSVPTLSFSGGGGSSAAATAVMCFTLTGFTVTAGGAVYGNAQPFALASTGGIVGGTAGAVVNPAIGPGLLVPRQGSIAGTSTAGGAIQTTGAVVNDGGLFSAVPTLGVTPAGNAIPTTIAQAAATVGGVSDTSLVQPI